jgi:hypothetical protein
LARSVELRRQQLEDDIAQFIKTKQADLRSHEQEVRHDCAPASSPLPRFWEYCRQLIWA